MAPETDDDYPQELARLRHEMSKLMSRIRGVTEQQIEVMDRCSTEEELEADAEYQALSRQKEALGAQYFALAERADQLIELLGD
jgi:hypothetical protein